MCNVFLAFEPLAGKRMVEVTERKTKKDWAHFMEDISDQYETAKKIKLLWIILIHTNPDRFMKLFHRIKQKHYGIDLNLSILRSMGAG